MRGYGRERGNGHESSDELRDRLMKMIGKDIKNTIEIRHDTIPYRWDDVPDRKYSNWLAMNHQVFNTVDFTAGAFPYMLQIEPTNVCNLSCPLCPVGRGELGREPRHLSFAEFKSIIDDMEPYLLFVILWDWGEPFLNPELPAMIRYAADRDIRVVTSTNAHFLHNQAYVEEVLKSGLSTLIVAIDSCDAESYRIYRKRGDLDRAFSGLSRLLELKKQVQSKTLINLRMMIMKSNERELPKMRQLAGELGVDWFSVKTVKPSCGSTSLDEETIPDNPKYRRYEYKKGTYERIRIEASCERIWQWGDIFSNGDVVRCCYDYKSEFKLGNVREEPFSRIWNSPAYREMRKKICSNKDAIPDCWECTINFKQSKRGWFVEYRDLRGNFKSRLMNDVKKSQGKLKAKYAGAIRKVRARF